MRLVRLVRFQGPNPPHLRLHRRRQADQVLAQQRVGQVLAQQRAGQVLAQPLGALKFQKNLVFSNQAL